MANSNIHNVASHIMHPSVSFPLAWSLPLFSWGIVLYTKMKLSHCTQLAIRTQKAKVYSRSWKRFCFISLMRTAVRPTSPQWGRSGRRTCPASMLRLSAIRLNGESLFGNDMEEPRWMSLAAPWYRSMIVCSWFLGEIVCRSLVGKSLVINYQLLMYNIGYTYYIKKKLCILIHWLNIAWNNS